MYVESEAKAMKFQGTNKVIKNLTASFKARLSVTQIQLSSKEFDGFHLPSR